MTPSSRAPPPSPAPPLIRVLKRGYTKSLRPVLRAPRYAFLAVIGAIVAGVLILPTLGQDLFPTFKEPDFLMHFVSKPGTSVGEQTRNVTELHGELRQVPGVEHVGTHIGQAILGEEVVGVNFSENWLSLARQGDYSKTLARVRAVAASHAGVFSDVQTYLHERVDEVLSGATQDMVIRIFGPDLGQLQRLAGRVTHQLSDVRGLVDLHPEAQQFIPEADVEVKLPVAKRYGLKPGDVRRAAAVLMASEPVADISSGGKLQFVAVWSTPSARRNLSDLSRMLIDTPGGGHVPLGMVATIRVRPTPSTILRENGSRKIEVTANMSGGA